MQKRPMIFISVAFLSMIAMIALLSSCSSTQADVNLDEIETQMDLGEYAEARDALEQIVAEDEANAEAHFMLGLAYFNLEAYSKARDSFERALALDPERAAAIHHNLGALAYQMGDMETALSEFRAALEADPDDPDTHYQLGATYLVLAFPSGAMEPDPDMVNQAETQFQRALELADEKPEAKIGLANIHLVRGEVDQAIMLLEEVLENNPEMREALFALGRAYLSAGEVDRAEATLERFLETDPPQIWAEQAETMLRQISP
jgi:tetratricopeptide (TPR) repeat protein